MFRSCGPRFLLHSMKWNQAPLQRCTSCLVARGSEAMMAFASVDLKDLTNSLEHSPESFHHCDFNKNLLAIFQFVIFATTWMEIQPQHKVTGWKSNHLVGNPTNNKNLENLKFQTLPMHPPRSRLQFLDFEEEFCFGFKTVSKSFAHTHLVEKNLFCHLVVGFPSTKSAKKSESANFSIFFQGTSLETVSNSVFFAIFSSLSREPAELLK